MTSDDRRATEPWWQQTTIYQIYPRSWRDTNDDGIGDLPGIIDSLDVLQSLGVETLWLSPIFTSPQDDGGYDVADYTAIDPRFGTMADADALIREAHARGMRIVFDFVMNHTSIAHPWFMESRSNRTNPKRDWYLWRPGRRGGAPNNWKAMVGGSGWHRDATTDEWYFASFLPFQPDLNYANPEVKQAMFDVARFWLARGVDGFRLDIFNCLGKDPAFRDNPRALRYVPSAHDHSRAFLQHRVHSMNHPSSYALARELRAVMDEFPGDRMLLGEVSGPNAAIKPYLGEQHDGLHLIFLFETVDAPFRASAFRDLLAHQARVYASPAIPTCVFSNHDVRRLAARLGPDDRRLALMALLQLTVRAVPVIYYGEELGVRGGDFPLAPSTDPVARQNAWIPKWLLNSLGILLNREDSRTPMPWNGEMHAGFTSPRAEPWLAPGSDWATRNVERQRADPSSLWRTYQRLLQLRRETPALHRGDMHVHDASLNPSSVVVYERRAGDERICVALNFAAASVAWTPPAGAWEAIGQVGGATMSSLGPFGGIVLRTV